jgi:hypothetical protein
MGQPFHIYRENFEEFFAVNRWDSTSAVELPERVFYVNVRVQSSEGPTKIFVG